MIVIMLIMISLMVMLRVIMIVMIIDDCGDGVESDYDSDDN